MDPKALRRALLAALATPKREDVTDRVPELAQALGGARLFIRELGGPERAAWFKRNQRSLEDSDARLVILSLVTEDGAPVFADGDAPELMKTTAVVSRLAQIAGRVSGLFWKEDEEGDLKNGRSTSASTARPAPAG